MFARLRDLSNLALLLAGLMAWPSAIPWTTAPANPGVAALPPDRGDHAQVRKHDSASPVDWPDELSIAADAEDLDEILPSTASLPHPWGRSSDFPSSLHDPRLASTEIVTLAPRSPLLRC